MPDIFGSEVKSITQPPRLVEISEITTTTKVITINHGGTPTVHDPKIESKVVEKWSIKAMVDIEWQGVVEKEFFFPTEAECLVIKPGYKNPI